MVNQNHKKNWNVNIITDSQGCSQRKLQLPVRPPWILPVFKTTKRYGSEWRRCHQEISRWLQAVSLVTEADVGTSSEGPFGEQRTHTLRDAHPELGHSQRPCNSPLVAGRWTAEQCAHVRRRNMNQTLVCVCVREIEDVEIMLIIWLIINHRLHVFRGAKRLHYPRSPLGVPIDCRASGLVVCKPLSRMYQQESTFVFVLMQCLQQTIGSSPSSSSSFFFCLWEKMSLSNTRHCTECLLLSTTSQHLNVTRRR